MSRAQAQEHSGDIEPEVRDRTVSSIEEVERDVTDVTVAVQVGESLTRLAHRPNDDVSDVYQTAGGIE